MYIYTHTHIHNGYSSLSAFRNSVAIYSETMKSFDFLFSFWSVSFVIYSILSSSLYFFFENTFFPSSYQWTFYLPEIHVIWCLLSIVQLLSIVRISSLSKDRVLFDLTLLLIRNIVIQLFWNWLKLARELIFWAGSQMFVPARMKYTIGIADRKLIFFFNLYYVLMHNADNHNSVISTKV